MEQEFYDLIWKDLIKIVRTFIPVHPANIKEFSTKGRIAFEVSVNVRVIRADATQPKNIIFSLAVNNLSDKNNTEGILWVTCFKDEKGHRLLNTRSTSKATNPHPAEISLNTVLAGIRESVHDSVLGLHEEGYALVFD